MRISDWSSDVCSSDLQLARVAGAQRDERLLLRTRDQFALGIAIGGKDVEPRHRIGAVELCGRPEVAAIGLQRLIERVGCEMRGEGVREPEHRRELRAEQARRSEENTSEIPSRKR